MCYQFNQVSPAKYKVTSPSAQNGLRLLLRSDQSEYLAIGDTATYKVAISGPNEEPFVDAFGYNVAAGYISALALTRTDNSRQQDPYGDCTTSPAGFLYYYGTSEYTMEGCLRSCYQQFIVQQCGCADPRFAKDASSSWCTFAQCESTAQCSPCHSDACVTALETAQANNADGAFDVFGCNCPQRCTDSTYSVTFSQAVWPSAAYYPQDCAMTTPTHGANASDCRTWYKQNSLVVHVYFETLYVTRLQENVAVAVSDAVATS